MANQIQLFSIASQIWQCFDNYIGNRGDKQTANSPSIYQYFAK